MELRDIKNINQRIYELDTEINRNNKVIFIASLIMCYKLNKDFQNMSKLTSLINFNEGHHPIDQIVALAKEEIKEEHLNPKTEKAIFDSLNTITGANTKLDHNRNELRKFIENFITSIPLIKPKDLFMETLYMEIDKKAKSNDTGIVLTPIFAARLMNDLLDLDYKHDVVLDSCCGTGLFSLLAFNKMMEDLEADKNNLSSNEYKKYKARIKDAIVANDIDSKMVTLCFANFLLNDLNPKLIYAESVFDLEKSSFKLNGETIQTIKAILNPPYEDKYKPIEIIEKNISLVKNNDFISKVVAILPPQKFGQKRAEFAKILNSATLETVVKMQDDLFKDSGIGQAASIFVFNANKYHDKNDLIHYYNFTDTGYVYLKDSGLVDKNHTYEQKKADLLKRINDKTPNKKSDFVRTWTNFYEVNKDLEIVTTIDPDKVRTNKEEADITLENITIKKMLEEKEALVNSCNNNFIDEDGSFENYIIDILSED